MDNHPMTEVITIDLKKYRIRIHKSSLHKIGDPGYIQLLVNPANKKVAIRALETCYSNDESHRVRKQVMASDNSYEIYSRKFMTDLSHLVGKLDKGCCYHLSGCVIESEKLLVFDLNTIRLKGLQEEPNE